MSEISVRASLGPSTDKSPPASASAASAAGKGAVIGKRVPSTAACQPLISAIGPMTACWLGNDSYDQQLAHSAPNSPVLTQFHGWLGSLLSRCRMEKQTKILSGANQNLYSIQYFKNGVASLAQCRKIICKPVSLLSSRKFPPQATLTNGML